MKSSEISGLNNLLMVGCEQLNLSLTEQMHKQLLSYLELLIKWNKVYNLTAINNPKDIIIKHLLDSLAILKYIDNNINNIIDVGTGAGLPGLVISMVKPNLKVFLLDSNNKKTSFLQQVKINQKLENITIINNRAENYVPIELFDAIISRAFASLVDYTEVVKDLIKPDGVIYAMKGKLPDGEILEFKDKYNNINKNINKNNFVINEVNKITVPYLAEDRYLIKIDRL